MVAGPALLPGADPRRDRRAELAVAVEILLDQRVLEPEQADLLVELASHPDRVLRRPAGQCDDVADHVDVLADRRPNRPGDGHVAGLVPPEGDVQVVPPATLHDGVALVAEPGELLPMRSRSPEW